MQTQRAPEAIKLFVGQVPRDFTEKDLRAVFEPYGDIHDLNVLHDKATGQHKGCAFLTFFENASAKAAQDELHERKTLPGATNPMQVKPAASEMKAENRKLFLGMLSRNLDENDLTNMFSTFGTIEDLTILKNPDGKSKGCAFIKYETRLQAQNAIKTMHNSETMEGCNAPIVVKIADTEKDKINKKRMQMGGAQNIPSMGMGIPSSLNPLLQQQQAYYQQLIAQMALPQLVAANPSLQGVPGTMGALVAAMATQQQQQQTSGNSTQAQSQAKTGQSMLGYGIPSVQSSDTLQQAYSGIQQYAASFPQAYNTVQPRQNIGGVQQTQPQRDGPEGANLFIYHIPEEFNDADLQQTFVPFGNVVSAKVFIDKATGLSKCFGFVSYDSPSSATAAINSMNGFAIGSKRLKVQLKRPKEQSKPY